MTSASDVVLNVVWVAESFGHLHPFVASQMAHTEARFRFVANGCEPEEVERMQRAAAAHPDQVVEVFEVSPTLVAHGVALEGVRRARHDGELFAAIDPDILVKAPFVEELLEQLGPGVVAVSSATEIWSTTNVVPEGTFGVAGEHFYDRDGFVFGGPHLVIYRREALDATCERWGVNLGNAGLDVPDAALEQIRSMGRPYSLFDTGKVVNILLQAGGDRVVQHELDQLVHLGGMSHYFDPASARTQPDGSTAPFWARFDSARDRYVVAHHTARLLDALLHGGERPEPPTGISESMRAKLELVQHDVEELVERYGGWFDDGR